MKTKQQIIKETLLRLKKRGLLNEKAIKQFLKEDDDADEAAAEKIKTEALVKAAKNIYATLSKMSDGDVDVSCRIYVILDNWSRPTLYVLIGRDRDEDESSEISNVCRKLVPNQYYNSFRGFVMAADTSATSDENIIYSERVY